MQRLRALVPHLPFLVSLIIAVFFTVLTALYESNPDDITFLARLAGREIDLKFDRWGYREAKHKIVVVAGDDKTAIAVGALPWDRGGVYAPLFERLCSYGPRAMVFDGVFTNRVVPAPPVLHRLLAEKLGAQATEELLAQASVDHVLNRALETCRGKAVLGYLLDEREALIPRDRYAERKQLLLEPEARNLMKGVVPPNATFSLFRGEKRGKYPFYYVVRSGDLNTPEVTPRGLAQGFMNNEQDNDGYFRHSQLLYRMDDGFVPSLALRTAQLALSPGDTPATVTFHENDDDIDLALPTPSGPRHFQLDPYGQAIVNYRGPTKTFPFVSLIDVLDDKPEIEYRRFNPKLGHHEFFTVDKQQLFRDALVIVGVTTATTIDIRPRPLDAVGFGVEYQATALDNILSNDFLTRLPAAERRIFLAALLAFGVAFGWALSRLRPQWGTALALAVTVGWFYFDQKYLFESRRLVLFSGLQSAQFLLQFVAVTSMRFMGEEKEKRQIRGAFDKYVSPAIIDTMLKDPSKLRLGGEKRSLTVLFADIRGFTSLSERLDVRPLSQLLNEYLGAMTEVIQSNSGTLDKYIGDAVMAFWGAPVEIADHARLAAKTAVEMIARLDSLNESFERKYGVRLDVGIGINTGEVSVGNFGSEKVFEYTVIGDNVNLASRLEGVNKVYGTHILVSEMTFALLEGNAYFSREIDTVRVKGRNKPVKIYEIIPDTPAQQALKAALKPFAEGLAAYYAGRWQEALDRFADVTAICPDDPATAELARRAREFRDGAAPIDWDGSWDMATK